VAGTEGPWRRPEPLPGVPVVARRPGAADRSAGPGMLLRPDQFPRLRGSAVQRPRRPAVVANPRPGRGHAGRVDRLRRAADAGTQRIAAALPFGEGTGRVGSGVGGARRPLRPGDCGVARARGDEAEGEAALHARPAAGTGLWRLRRPGARAG